ncbi:MAG: hypothetical protein AMJ54_04400 [Deltaproteobacteria bacterium SG8_13]|nr:MAG: hypothetical protein AMJ54_04400 [Deltaproteobacteria bacterium SG8_13]
MTEELQQSEDDDDITIAEDDEIMELEDITDVSADTEVAILELDEAIDALAEPKEEILAPVDDPIESEEAIIDLHDTIAGEAADSEPAAAGPSFAIETETVELTDSDRKALEQEFGFETEDEGPPDGDTVAEQPAEGGFLAGTLDQDLDDTIELTETVGDAAETPSAGQPLAYPEEPLELTEEDRATLEEEIGSETIEEISPDVVDAPEPMEAETQEADLTVDEPVLVPEEIEGDQPEQELTDEAEIRFDAEELSMADDAEEQPFGFDTAPEQETAEPAPDALQRTMELADVNGEALQAEIGLEAVEPAAEEFSTDQEVVEEILDVGLDEEQPLRADESATEEADASLAVEGLGLTDEPGADMVEPGISGSEEFTIESPADAAEEETPLTAEDLTDADVGLESEMSEPAYAPSGTTFDTEEDETAAEIAGASANGMSVDFDQAETFEQADLHKDADPISIRVKEPETEDHADEDALLDKVFEPQAGAASPQELEQTVERVVGKMLAEKIEVILADAIEKAVEKEIGRLKKLLIDDLNRLE